ncbi:phosphopantetheine-binding protein [Micromonospora sp. DT233]|uniref:phosphopantetheine-binding protein n=1 Tax=Micromonospora sp. DT233 TaxID=3393432 RepID=UPI003CEA71B3
MKTIDTFVTLLQDEMGLPVTPENVTADLDEIPGWDSMYLIELLVILERVTGKQVSLPHMIEARSLREIFDLADAA